MTPFSTSAISIIKNIPKGKVLTYGGIAAMAGSPRGARQIARLLHSSSKKHNLPWHRVINSQGKISLKGPLFDLQKSLLSDEGVEVIRGAVDLKVYLWRPLPGEIPGSFSPGESQL